MRRFRTSQSSTWTSPELIGLLFRKPERPHSLFPRTMPGLMIVRHKTVGRSGDAGKYRKQGAGLFMDFQRHSNNNRGNHLCVYVLCRSGEILEVLLLRRRLPFLSVRCQLVSNHLRRRMSKEGTSGRPFPTSGGILPPISSKRTRIRGDFCSVIFLRLWYRQGLCGSGAILAPNCAKRNFFRA